MILQFAFNNFRCVRDDCELEFRKMNLKQHTESLINGSVLPVAVIYGPNGGGKSTVLMAVDYLFRLVGNPIRQTGDSSRAYPIPSLTPFLLDEESRDKPSEFSLLFTLGKDDPVERKYYIRVFRGEILEESLYEKGRRGPSSLMFERKDGKITYGTKYQSFPSSIAGISQNLPLLSLLTIMFSESEIGKVGRYFANTALLDFGSAAVEQIMAEAFVNLVEDKDLKTIVDQILERTQVVSGYDVIEDKLASGQRRKVVRTKHVVDGVSYELPIGEESAGTHKLFEILPAVVCSLVAGTMTVIDELDAKLHPKLLEFLIGLFTNPKTNENGAQLLFTSHDMYTLRSEVFRRDEIWFAAKDDQGSTILYSLGDIKGEDHRTTRSDLSFSKQYLDGRYGADPYYKRMNGWEDFDAQ